VTERVLTRASRPHLVIASVVAVLAGVAYAAVSLLRFRRFTLSSWDNAIFEQALQGYAHLRAPIVDIKGPGFNILGDHFSPIYALLAPVYRLFPAAQTLLVSQAVLLAFSVAVVTALALRTLGTVTGTVLGVAYALSFGLQSAVASDFHEIAFGVPLLALAGAAYVDRRPTAVVAWSLPLLLVKEDLGLTVAVIGGVLWWSGARRRGAALAVAGVLGAAIVVLVLVPAMNPDDGYAYASALGGDRGIVATLFTDTGRKLETVLLTVAVTGFAALASPWALVALPTLAWRFAGDNPYYWGTDFHYSALLMPVLFVAAVDAMARWPRLRWAAVVAAAVTASTVPGSPVVSLVDPETYEPSVRAEQAREVMSLVPDGASVETDIGLINHLVTDHEVYWTGTVGDAKPEYVLFDVASGIGSPQDVVAYAEQAHGGTYELIYTDGGYVLARRTPR
jgi:uncharacterized membrane protein